MNSEQLRCTISGSFKFKPEIERTREEFEDEGVSVLGPEIGWLYVPHIQLYTPNSFRPLPSERDMSLKQAEDKHLYAISKSHFLYLVNPDGYIGTSGWLETGAALGLEVPVFARHEININNEPLEKILYIRENIQIKSIKETVFYMRKRINKPKIYLPPFTQ